MAIFPQSNPWAEALVYYSLVVEVVLVYLFYRIMQQRKLHKTMAQVTNPLMYLSLSMLIWPIVFIVSRMSYLISNDIIEVSYTAYFMGYSVYFVFWIVGLARYLQSTVRLPNRRKETFLGVLKFFRILAIVSFILGVLSPLIQYIPNVDVPIIVEGFFVVMNLIALASFYYFQRIIRNEREKNASKLVKARLDLLRYSVWFQMACSITIILGGIVLILSLISEDVISEFFIFGIILIYNVITSLILFWSVNIPHRIRVRYNITPKRFQSVRRIERR